MINELMKLADAVKDVPVDNVWHSNMQPLPKVSAKSPCIRIWITSEGKIDSLERMSGDLTSRLRKYAPNKFSSLPGFNVAFLGGLDGETREKEHKKALSGLKKNFSTAHGEIKAYCGAKLSSDETLAKFLDAIEKIDIEEFLADFEEIITTNDWGWEASKGQKLSVFLDIKAYNKYPVAHTKTMERLNALISSNQEILDENIRETEIGFDAYHLKSNGFEELFGDITIPRMLGQIKVRSLNADIPAQARYRLSGSMTFPVGNEARNRARIALEWASALDNEGCTFGIAGEKELLFAYPVEMPQSKTPLARFLGAESDLALAKEKFRKLAESVIEQLKGQGTPAKNMELEIFALRKMDKARTKVVYYRNISVDALECASRVWDDGCQNIPKLDIHGWTETEKGAGRTKDKKCQAPVLVNPVTVFPIRLHRFLNAVWTRDLRQSKVRLFVPGDGLSLLLNPDPSGLAGFMLERFLQHAQGYFLDLCVCRGRGEISKVPDKALYPGILGLLLYKLNQRKENYMKETAYLLGRFLRIADEIHRLYCKYVRQGQYPAELCGSSLLTAMQESPVMTLAQLCQRAGPYIKWARAYQKEGSGLVHYFLNQWGMIADELHAQSLPQRLDTAERAEVFLGYLASFSKNENNININTEQVDETNQGD